MANVPNYHDDNRSSDNGAPGGATRTGASPTGASLTALHARIEREGFAFVPAAHMRPLLEATNMARDGLPEGLGDLPRFASSWDDLALDNYLPDGHRYRRRRHATLSARAGERVYRVEPRQPHYQGIEYNPLAGGVQRWFEPIEADVIESATMRHVLAFCCDLFGSFRPSVNWHIECHQFRIEARRDAPGQPTPEGVHRDGVDYVLVLLINRTNIASGTTTVHEIAGTTLGSFTLSAPLDAALVDDARVKHGVTPVEPIDPALPAFRDVLVVTFRAK